jgi:hypothetical protein
MEDVLRIIQMDAKVESLLQVLSSSDLEDQVHGQDMRCVLRLNISCVRLQLTACAFSLGQEDKQPLCRFDSRATYETSSFHSATYPVRSLRGAISTLSQLITNIKMHCHFHLKEVDGLYYIDYHEDIIQPKVCIYKSH